MNTTIKDILAVMAGVFLSTLTMKAIQLAGHFFFPLPNNIDQESAESMAAHMADISLGAMLFVLLAWFFAWATGGACPP